MVTHRAKLKEGGHCVSRVRWGFWRKEHTDLAFSQDRIPLWEGEEGKGTVNERTSRQMKAAEARAPGRRGTHWERPRLFLPWQAQDLAQPHVLVPLRGAPDSPAS